MKYSNTVFSPNFCLDPFFLFCPYYFCPFYMDSTHRNFTSPWAFPCGIFNSISLEPRLPLHQLSIESFTHQHTGACIFHGQFLCLPHLFMFHFCTLTVTGCYVFWLTGTLEVTLLSIHFSAHSCRNDSCYPRFVSTFLWFGDHNATLSEHTIVGRIPGSLTFLSYT